MAQSNCCGRPAA